MIIHTILFSVIFFILIAFIMELVDSSLGMMYGTILSPLLIGFGLEPIIVIPSILLSQSIGAIGGTISHHYHKNANFNGFNGLTKDIKVVMAMVIPGLFAVGLGVFLGINLPIIIIKSYICFIVFIMSVLCLTTFSFKFSWWKHVFLGTVAAFNKAFSGGGFGPVTSTGGIISGLDSKVSVATTTFAELFICFASFSLYILFTGEFNYVLIISLSIGALAGGIIGPSLIKKINHKKLRTIIGCLGIISSAWLLLKIIYF